MAGFTPTTLGKGSYTKLESRLRRDMSAAAASLSSGQISRTSAFLSLSPALTAATREAMLWGKRVGMGGAACLLTPGEERLAAQMGATQTAFLRAWLTSSGPLVKPGGQGIGPRLDLYALSIHSAFQMGLSLGLLQAASNEKGIALLQGDPVWIWQLSHAPGLQSCSDCMDRARRSLQVPYTLTELMTIGFPAQGKTKCLTRCRCRLRLSDLFGDAILRARAHGRAKPTAYHGVVDPDTLAQVHPLTVGPGFSK